MQITNQQQAHEIESKLQRAEDLLAGCRGNSYVGCFTTDRYQQEKAALASWNSRSEEREFEELEKRMSFDDKIACLRLYGGDASLVKYGLAGNFDWTLTYEQESSRTYKGRRFASWLRKRWEAKLA